MFRRLLAIIGLVFAGLAAWPAWTDSVAEPAPTRAEAPRASPRDRAIRIGGRACRSLETLPVAHSLLRLFDVASRAGRQPGTRLCACAATAGAPKAGPGSKQAWTR